ncbi:MAG: baseplate J/gp47 family protein, partial [Acinetobacter sp.]
EPYTATKAVLKGEFTPTTIDVTGQRFNVGEMNYTVTEQIEPGIYQVGCETAGIIGNQYLGNMIPMEYIDGLETAELTKVLIPGEDDEDTEVLRTRYFASFDSQSFGGNRQDYIEKTNAIAGVGCTKVTAVWNADISPSSMIPSATVTAWYNSVVGGVSEEVKTWLSNIYIASYNKKLTTGGTVKLTILDSDYNKASRTLIDKVQTAIDPTETAGEGFGIAPIGHVVSVDTPMESSITVKTSLTFETGYSWSNLQASVNAAIEAYLLELRKTWADESYLIVRVSQIETRLLAIKGVLDVTGTKINDSENNFTLGSCEIPVFGGATT